MKKIAISISEFIYIAAFALWSFSMILGYTMYPYQYQAIVTIMLGLRTLAMFLVVIKLLIDRKYSYKFILILFPSIVLFALIAFKSTQVKFFVAFGLFLIGAKNVNLINVLRVHAYVLGTIIILTYIGLKTGLISNIGQLARLGTVIRYSEGYRFTTFGANIVFHITVIWGFVRGKKLTFIEIISLALLNYYFYIRTDTKSAFFLSTLYLVCLVLLKVRKFQISEKILTYCERLTLLISTLIPITLSFLYDTRLPLMYQLNNLLTGRLQLGYQARSLYGVKLFGQEIRWVTADYLGKITGALLYVDASFLNILLNYGAVFLVLIVLGFWKLSKTNPYKNIYYSISIMIIFLHSMWDPQFLELWFNPFLLFLTIFISQSEQDKSLAKQYSGV
ncbi:hypothetical protein K6V35_06290 [Streptococcus suis]|nr:hypothetical protein [Streptococcus suis]MBY5039289.1 hypothetical protein [Streptococcus suis]